MPRGRVRDADVYEPLWERIDRNKRRYALLVVVYVLAVTAFSLFVFYGFPAFALLFLAAGEDVLLLSWRTFGVAALVDLLLVSLYTLYMLERSETVVLRRLGAERVSHGEEPETKRALHDMAVAAGFDHPPPLYMLDSSAVNAMVVGRGPRTGAVAVTRGLARRLDIAEERAVYAHLLSRLNARDTAWATVSTVLMHPLWVWKKRYYDVVPFERPAGSTYAGIGIAGPRSMVADSFMGGWRGAPDGTEFSDMRGDTCLLFPPYVVAVVAAHYMMAGQRAAQLRSAEFADAAGMMLLKDPQAMVSALEKVVREENHVSGCGGQYAQFFYAWTGDMSTNDERDPEYRRLVRIKQTLGAAVAGEPEYDLSHLVPPVAPRIAELRRDEAERG